MAQSWTKAQCIEAAYKAAKQQGQSVNAVIADTYCSCRVANQNKMSAATADQYCAGLAKESIPKDPAVERAKMLLIEQMMAPRKPTVIERVYEQYMYDQLYRSFPSY
jgi:lipopolysaccharide biosynthesis regulator YciM